MIMITVIGIFVSLLFAFFGLLSIIYSEKMWFLLKKSADLFGIDNKYNYNEGSKLFGVNKNKKNQINFIKFMGWVFVFGGLLLFVL